MYSRSSRMAKAGAVWLAALCLLATAGAASAQSYTNNAMKALTWMKTQQQPDGSFAGFGAGSTVDAVLAILAAGQDPAAYSQNGNTPVSFLEIKAGDLAKTPGGAGKLLLAVSALGDTGRPFGPYLPPLGGPKNLITAINATYDPNTGHYGKDIIGHAFAMLGLAKFGGPGPKAAQYLESVQAADGGWSFAGDTKAGAADTNTTAVAIQTLVAVGADKANPDVISKAVAYLASQQNPDGGYPYQKGGENGSDSDANSTAYVVQALNALGKDTAKPVQFLLSLQNASGAFRYQQAQTDDNAGATYQAISALLGATLVSPLMSVPTQAPAGTTDVEGGAASPGMPSTGNNTQNLLSALAAIAFLILGAGVIARRKAAAR